MAGNVGAKFRKCGSSACIAMLKTILFFFNVIFFALGACLFLIGIYGLKDLNSTFTFASNNSVWLAFICIGVFMLVVAVFSFWYIPKGVTWLLNFYGLVVFILCIAVVCASSAFMIKRDSLENTLKTEISYIVNHYPAKAVSLDIMQSTMHCCGAETYTEWFKTKWSDKQDKVPVSCCINKDNCVHENLLVKNATDIWQEGCYMKMRNTIEKEYTLIGGLGFASSFIIFFGAILSWWLASNIKSNRYEVMQ
jgi:hypothetical protein